MVKSMHIWSHVFSSDVTLRGLNVDMRPGRAFNIFSAPAFLLTAPVTPFIYIIGA